MNFKTNKEKEVFILTEDLSMYIIPKEEIKNRTTLNINEEHKRYKVNI